MLNKNETHVLTLMSSLIFMDELIYNWFGLMAK